MRRVARILLPAAVLLALSTAPAHARTNRLKVNLAAWPASLSGVQQVNSGSIDGSPLDLQGTLGIEDDTFPELHAALKLLGPVRLIGSYYSTQYAGEETITQSITFNGTTYSASETVESELEMNVGRVMLSFSPINFKRLNIGLMLGAELMSVDSSLASSATGEEQDSFTAPIPIVGVNLTLQPTEKLALYVEASGLSADVGGVDADVLDAIVRVEYYFLPWFAVTGGYRLFDFDIVEDDFGRVNFEQDGIQAGLAFRL
jgi:hypothetical protein